MHPNLGNLVPVERLNEGKPILERIPDHPWESKVTFNPACVLVGDKQELERIIPELPFSNRVKDSMSTHSALCFLLYRAQGKRTSQVDYTRSSIGLAVLTPDLKLLARHIEPVIFPDRDYDNLGAEDPRITKVDDNYVMSYTAYCAGEPTNRIRIGIATSTNLIHWKKHGLVEGDFNSIDNKNAVLFPDRVRGEYVMLHRPMKGDDAMSIHWATGEELFGTWTTHGVLLKPLPNPAFVDTWIGAGAPPLRLPNGQHLLLYHIGNRAKDGSREYDLGIAICHPEHDRWIVKRDEPLLRPETPAECKGDSELGVNNVVFVCGAYFHSGYLYFPYAGADSVILAGRVSGSDLQRYLSI